MILTLPDRAERRRIAKRMHKTQDKDHYRRLNAILLLSKASCCRSLIYWTLD